MTAEAQLQKLAALEAGWDSYGADPIHPDAIAAVRALLDSVRVGPLVDGGLSLTFACPDFEVSVDIMATGCFEGVSVDRNDR